MTEPEPAGEQAETAPVGGERTGGFALVVWEKRALVALAGRLPRWVLPDDLTALGVLAAAGITGCYLASNHSRWWLLACCGLLVVHWLGDSLDGTLARVREIQRPRYGYYLDHLVDAFSTIMVGLGLGLSPYMTLAVGLAFVVAYLALSINVYLEATTFGEFNIGYGGFGPTEARILLLVVNLLLFAIGSLQLEIWGTRYTLLDAAGVGVVLVMIGLLLGRAVRNLRLLAREEPAASRSQT